MEKILLDTKNDMSLVVESLKKDLDTISTGRANPSLLNTVYVHVYGQTMPISNLANVNVSDPVTLSISVWDSSTLPNIEKAIREANLGFSVTITGTIIRVEVPMLTGERRNDLSKLVKKYNENKKVSVRNVRRESIETLKQLEKELSKDDITSMQSKIQKTTDEYIALLDKISDEKTSSIMN